MLSLFASPAFAGTTPLLYAIVTDQSLAPSFQPLADFHATHGCPAEVHTLQEIRIFYPVAFDDAERVRLWLRDMANTRGLFWVLIGGDATVVPMRQVLVRAGVSNPPGTMLYTDAYYSCLDGTWNDDGDGIFGEQPEDGGVEVPDLRVGRAPVRTPVEAQAFVAKMIAANFGIDREAPLRALLAANVFELPPLTMIDKAERAEQLAAILATRAGTHTVRLYQNAGAWPGSYPENAASVLDSLSARTDLAILDGQGGIGLFQAGAYPADLLNDAQFAALSNPAPGVAFFVSAYTTVPGASVGRGMILAPGGAAAVLGTSDAQFITIAGDIAERFVKAVINLHAETVGDAWVVAAAPLFPGSESPRLSTLGLVLFGDPRLPMPGSAEPIVPLRLSLVESSTAPGEAHLSWFAADAAGAALVERRTNDSEWSVLGEANALGQGSYTYVDRVPDAGRYGYRLRIGGDVSEEAWLDVPVASLSLAGFRPNPAGAARTVHFTLATSEPATLTVVDVRGRTVARHEVGATPGPHAVDLGGGIAPGVYWLRLAQGDAVRQTRGVVAH